MKAVQFNGDKIFISLRRGRLEAIDEEGFAYMVISLPHESLIEGEVCVKNYTENEGILDVLIANKIVERPHRFIRQGYVAAPVCKLLI